MDHVFVKWCADKLDDLHDAIRTPEDAGRLRQKLEAADRFFCTWADSHQGNRLDTGLGKGTVTLAAEFLDELTQNRRAYRTAAGPVSVGVGRQDHEAQLALELAQARGGNREVIHSSKTQAQLDAIRAVRDQKQSRDLLSTVQPDDETPETEPLLNDVQKAEQQFYLPGVGSANVNRPMANPKTIKYVRRIGTEKTPNYGERFNQHVEPAGEYMSPHDHDPKNMPEVHGKYEQWGGATFMEYGKIHFNNPLVVPHNNNIGWKKDVSEMFGGKAGRALSTAIKRRGHDGIIATGDDGEPQEIVNLRGTKEVVQPFPQHIEFYPETRRKLPGGRRQFPPGTKDNPPEPAWKPQKYPDSPEFHAWFKGSKVIDNAGMPLVVFHGTRKDFAAFDPSTGGSATGAPSATQGFFFSRRPNTADSYTNMVLPEEKEQHEAIFGEAESLRRKWSRSHSQDEKRRAAASAAYARSNDLYQQASEMRRNGGRVIPVYLSMKNPMVFDMKARGYREQSYYDLIQQAKEAGHDGLVVRNSYDAVMGDGNPDDIYVAFAPTQIKSALAPGKFDPNDPHLAKMEADLRKNVERVAARSPAHRTRKR